ncbi:MAG TPA: rhomboid family intramembrane serine protease [Opitutaceae bacterium]|nr:rhomboid family intramembrane serine protease [Opitutaceae bacterium]
MRDSYPRTGRSAVVWIVSATIAAFILTNVFERLFLSRSFGDLFGLSIDQLKHGYVWQLLTYGFFHQPGDMSDVLIFCFNLLCLYLLGRELESLLGSKRFIGLYAAGILLGGLAWVACNYRFGHSLMSAWPGVAALFTMYACLNANQRIPLLIFFVFPVTLKPKYLAWAALTFDLFGLVFYELRDGHGPFGYHSHHLGGMLAGVLYYQFVYKREWRTPDGLAEIELPKWLRKKQQAPEVEAPAFKVNLDRDSLRAEVDRILDKINSEGFNALTDDEKRLLDDAKDLLSRH